jgi:hypothetical protein
MVLADVFGWQLPDYAYTSAEDRGVIGAVMETGLAADWIRQTGPQEGALVIFNVAGRPWHCGVMIDAKRFLHWPPPSRDGRQLLSCVERLDSPVWSRRVEGFYLPLRGDD